LPKDDRPTTAKDLRLLCRTHNQYEAERRLGAEFMRHKREQARLDAEQGRARKAAKESEALASAEAWPTAEAQIASDTPSEVEAHAAERAADEARAHAAAIERAKEQDVVPWLRQLGYRATDAREAARLCESIPDAPLEQRIRVALSYFQPRGTYKIS